MATYGPYYGAAESGRQLAVTIIAVQDVASNTSTVRAIVQMVSSNGIPRVSDRMLNTTSINGTYTGWYEAAASYGSGTYQLSDSYRVIPHDANGNANATIVAAVQDLNGGFALSVTVTTLTLPNIPRGTTPEISGGGGFTTGAASTISLPRADSSYTHDVTYKFGAQTGTIATGAGVTASWTPPHTLLTEIPNSESGQLEITVVTKQGATNIGSKKVNFALTAGATVLPTVSGVTWDDANPVVKSAIGAYVQGQSLVKGVVAAAGVHGSTIASKSLTIAGAEVTESQVWEPATSGTIAASGKATDSRGRTNIKSANFAVLPYTKPSLTSATVRRATTAAGAVGDGAYLRMDLTAMVQSLIVGTQKNALRLRVRTRPTGGAWSVRNDITHSALSYSNALIMVSGGAAFPINASFEVEITVTDNLGQSATVTRLVGTGGASFDIAKNGTGHNKIWERGAVDAAGDGYFTGDIYLGATPVKASKEGHTHTGVQVSEATETARGTVERATQAEVNSGADTTRFLTPKTARDTDYRAFAEAAGRILTSTSGVIAVTLPVGRFTTGPIIGATVIDHPNVCVPHARVPTATSFLLSAYTIGGAIVAAQVDWHATQMTSSSASG